MGASLPEDHPAKELGYKSENAGKTRSYQAVVDRHREMLSATSSRGRSSQENQIQCWRETYCEFLLRTHLANITGRR